MTLNEYCLRHLFKFLQPRDWIYLSEVCKLWKEVTLIQWQKIKKISRLPTSGYNENAPTISVEEVKEIMKFVAPYITVLDLSQHTFENCITFGNYLYRVENLGDDEIVSLLMAENATEITEARFYKLPKIEVSKILFTSNRITKVEFCDSPDIYPNIPTNGIKEMNVEFTNYDNIYKFKDLFPDLKILRLKLQCLRYVNIDLKDKPKKILRKIVPHVSGLRELHLKVEAKCKDPHLMLGLFVLYDIRNYTELEEMSIESFDMHLINTDYLIRELTSYCPKIKHVAFRGIKIYESELNKMRLMPNLTMDLQSAWGAGWTLMRAKSQYLNELRIRIDHF